MLCGNDKLRGATRWKSHNRNGLMRLQFETVDVFTADQFSGNPLAVVLNAEGLSTQQMQSIAAEFNLAETTFVLPPKDNAHTAEVRIFTPRAEMPLPAIPMSARPSCWRAQALSMAEPSRATMSCSRKRQAWFR
jgi:PhzF family phenazine biosynthesis protein